MRAEDHVGLGISYTGFGGPSASTSASSPRSLRARGGSSQGEDRRWKHLGKFSTSPTPLFGKRFSIWFCLFVLALSAGVKYVHHRDPARFYRVAHVLGLRERFRYSLLWMAPILSGGGYCSEALTFVDALNFSMMVKELKVNHHGGAESFEFWKGLPLQTRKTLLVLLSGEPKLKDSVIVCHSEPDAWYPPLSQTAPCPPTGYTVPKYVIGRTILETSSINPNHVERCNNMDEIWVPTQFHVERLQQAGVNPAKIVKVVQVVDTHFFNPVKTTPAEFPAESKVRVFHPYIDVQHLGRPFVFLSIFKWETTKGWDVLLSAFLQEFTADDNVMLYVVTNPKPHSTDDFLLVLRKFMLSLHLHEPSSGWGEVHVIDKEVPQALLPGLYKAADCFVLPSRGEAWGRPILEAMAMELPVIATHWSGSTEYMTEYNSYPLQESDMSEILIDGASSGHYWADPAQSRLMKLMRRVVENPGEAKYKGKRARQDTVAKFSPEVVAKQVLAQLFRIQQKLDFQHTLALSNSKA
jgi:glycosyltransferase involved in cell wall biosynthesis